MTVHTEQPVTIAAVVRARARMELAQLDYNRALRSLPGSAQDGPSQREVARRLGISQPAVSHALTSASSSPVVPAGFVGASPREIIQRHTAGEIDRARLVEELGRWDYAPIPGTRDEVDDIIIIPAGTFEEVADAWRAGLIDEDTYVAIQDRFEQIREEKAAAGPA